MASVCQIQCVYKLQISRQSKCRVDKELCCVLRYLNLINSICTVVDWTGLKPVPTPYLQGIRHISKSPYLFEEKKKKILPAISLKCPGFMAPKAEKQRCDGTDSLLSHVPR